MVRGSTGAELEALGSNVKSKSVLLAWVLRDFREVTATCRNGVTVIAFDGLLAP